MDEFWIYVYEKEMDDVDVRRLPETSIDKYLACT